MYIIPVFKKDQSYSQGALWGGGRCEYPCTECKHGRVRDGGEVKGVRADGNVHYTHRCTHTTLSQTQSHHSQACSSTQVKWRHRRSLANTHTNTYTHTYSKHLQMSPLYCTAFFLLFLLSLAK